MSLPPDIFLDKLQRDLNDVGIENVTFALITRYHQKFCSFFQTSVKRVKPHKHQVKQLTDCCIAYMECIRNYVVNTGTLQQRQVEDVKQFIQIVETIPNLEGVRNDFVQNIATAIFQTVTDPEIQLWFGKEVLSSFTKAVQHTNSDLRSKIAKQNLLYLCKLMDLLSACGDYEYELILMKTVFCLCSDTQISNYASTLFPECEMLQKAISDIDRNNFDRDLRVFLNSVNNKSKKVFSIKCDFVFLENTEVAAPKEYYGDQLPFWVDFNTGSKTVTFKCDRDSLRTSPPSTEDSAGGEWETVTIEFSNVKKVLISRLQMPVASDSQGSVVFFSLIPPCGVLYSSSLETARAAHLNLAIYDCPELLQLETEILLSMYGDKFQNLMPSSHQPNQKRKTSITGTWRTKPACKPLKTRKVSISHAKSMNGVSSVSNAMSLKNRLLQSEENTMPRKERSGVCKSPIIRNIQELDNTNLSLFRDASIPSDLNTTRQSVDSLSDLSEMVELFLNNKSVQQNHDSFIKETIGFNPEGTNDIDNFDILRTTENFETIVEKIDSNSQIDLNNEIVSVKLDHKKNKPAKEITKVKWPKCSMSVDKVLKQKKTFKSPGKGEKVPKSLRKENIRKLHLGEEESNVIEDTKAEKVSKTLDNKSDKLELQRSEVIAKGDVGKLIESEKTEVQRDDVYDFVDETELALQIAPKESKSKWIKPLKIQTKETKTPKTKSGQNKKNLEEDESNVIEDTKAEKVSKTVDNKSDKLELQRSEVIAKGDVGKPTKSTKLDVQKNEFYDFEDETELALQIGSPKERKSKTSKHTKIPKTKSVQKKKNLEEEKSNLMEDTKVEKVLIDMDSKFDKPELQISKVVVKRDLGKPTESVKAEVQTGEVIGFEAEALQIGAAKENNTKCIKKTSKIQTEETKTPKISVQKQKKKNLEEEESNSLGEIIAWKISKLIDSCPEPPLIEAKESKVSKDEVKVTKPKRSKSQTKEKKPSKSHKKESLETIPSKLQLQEDAEPILLQTRSSELHVKETFKSIKSKFVTKKKGKNLTDTEDEQPQADTYVFDNANDESSIDKPVFIVKKSRISDSDEIAAKDAINIQPNVPSEILTHSPKNTYPFGEGFLLELKKQLKLEEPKSLKKKLNKKNKGSKTAIMGNKTSDLITIWQKASEEITIPSLPDLLKDADTMEINNAKNTIENNEVEKAKEESNIKLVAEFDQDNDPEIFNKTTQELQSALKHKQGEIDFSESNFEKLLKKRKHSESNLDEPLSKNFKPVGNGTSTTIKKSKKLPRRRMFNPNTIDVVNDFTVTDISNSLQQTLLSDDLEPLLVDNHREAVQVPKSAVSLEMEENKTVQEFKSVGIPQEKKIAQELNWSTADKYLKDKQHNFSSSHEDSIQIENYKNKTNFEHPHIPLKPFKKDAQKTTTTELPIKKSSLPKLKKCKNKSKKYRSLRSDNNKEQKPKRKYTELCGDRSKQQKLPKRVKKADTKSLIKQSKPLFKNCNERYLKEPSEIECHTSKPQNSINDLVTTPVWQDKPSKRAKPGKKTSDDYHPVPPQASILEPMDDRIQNQIQQGTVTISVEKLRTLRSLTNQLYSNLLQTSVMSNELINLLNTCYPKK